MSADQPRDRSARADATGTQLDVAPAAVRSTTVFAIVPLWVITSSVSDRAVRLYALLRGKWADRDLRAWPSRRTIASALRTSTKSVDRALRELLDAGAVRVERRFTSSGDQISNLLWLVDADPRDTDVAPPRHGGPPHIPQKSRGRDAPVHRTRSIREQDLEDPDPTRATHTRARGSATHQGCEPHCCAALDPAIRVCLPAALADEFAGLVVGVPREDLRPAVVAWARQAADDLPAGTLIRAGDRFKFWRRQWDAKAAYRPWEQPA